MLSNLHHSNGHDTNYGANYGTNYGTNYGAAGNTNSASLRPIQYLPFNSFYQHSFPPPIQHDLNPHPHPLPHPLSQPLSQPLLQPLPQPLSQPFRKISINEINVFKKPEKRKRKKFNEVERFYSCNHANCSKSYGTLNHLNSHIFLQNHGRKRLPQEFKEIRLKLKLKRKLEREKDREKERSRQEQREKAEPPSEPAQNDRQALAVGSNSNTSDMDAGNKMLTPAIYSTYYDNNNTTNNNTTNTTTKNSTGTSINNNLTNTSNITSANSSTSATTTTMAGHNNNYFTHTPAHYSNYPDYSNYINYPNSLYSPRNTTLSNLNANLNYAFNLNNYKI